MAINNSKANKTVGLLFAVQTSLFFLGLFSESTNIFSAQWIAWSLTGLFSLIIGFILIDMLLKHIKLEKITVLALICNVLGIAVALFVHYSPNLG